MATANENNKLITNLLLIVGGYFVVLKPLLIRTGILPDPDVKKVEERKKELLNTEIKTLAKTEKPTKSNLEWQVIADKIYSDLRYSSIDDDKADAGYQVARVKNNIDFAILFKYFGKRREYHFGMPDGALKNLPEMVTHNLSRTAIDKINKNYRSKGIKFQF